MNDDTSPVATISTGPARWSVTMAARDADERHRVSTPLELLFDLTFVVAVSQASVQLAASVEHDDIGHAVVGYLMDRGQPRRRARAGAGLSPCRLGAWQVS